MRKIAVLLALLALAVSAGASPVTLEQAQASARAWAARGQVLGARFGASVERASALAVATNATVYAVKMTSGGTVFVAGDDAYEPIVAFTAATNDYSTIDRRSPLWALLQRDAEVRAKLAAAGVTSRTATSAKKTIASPKMASRSYEPSDLRVAPLVQSQWDQTTVGGKLCYNRYTPVLKTGEHATCGCVATAMSQIMRYHQFPTASCDPVTRTCYVNVYLATKADGPDYAGFITNLTTQAGVYDWANMPLVPADGVTDEQCEAIGKLTSDAGISVYMAYGADEYGSSGALGRNVPKSLKEVFGYANADFYGATEVSANTSAMRQGFLANLDAGYPVQMGITGDGGHAIVGDGYGYEDETLYVHLNMGWSGESDLWYTLPDIGTGYKFNVFGDMVCNIFPEDAEKNALLTGRVVDDDEIALDDVAVRVYAAGTKTLVATDLTTNGVYGVRIPAGKYDVEFEKMGYPVETLSSVDVAATKSESSSVCMIIKDFGNENRWLSEDYSYSKISSFGNSHGNDVTITEPCAQIVVGTATNVYATLDKAIAAGAALVAAGAPGAKIELLKPIELKATTTIDYACAILAAGDAADAPITRSGASALAVAAGGTLAISNVTFEANASTAVTVAEGGALYLGAAVDFGVPSSVAAVQTADAAGFVMADVLSSGFTLDCAAAKLANDAFGVSRLSASETASNSAARVANVYDRYGEMRGVVETTAAGSVLKWAEIPVPLSESAGYFVDASGATNTAARLDRVFERYQEMQAAGKLGESCEIVVCDRSDLEFSTRVEVRGDLTVRGEDGTSRVAISSWGGDAGFDIGEGATLTIRDFSFDGYQGEAFLRVKGGDLNVSGVTEFANFVGTNKYSGVIAVLSGTATVGAAGGSVVFAGCRATGGSNVKNTGSGGAIYLADGACSATLQDHVVITNCSATGVGGGVYMGRSSKNGYATLGLSGYLVIEDNFTSSEGKATPSDIAEYRVSGATDALSLVLAGEIETGSSVGVIGAGSGKGNITEVGNSFLRVASGFTDKQKILASCSAFFNDLNADCETEPSSDYATLVWAADDGSIKEVEPAAAIASVKGADGVLHYYGTIDDAFAVVDGTATITVLGDATFESDLVVTSCVTLASGDGGPFTVSRAASCSVNVLAGGDLTLTNVTVRGSLDSSRGGTGVLFDVQAGSLTMDDGATICDVEGNGEQRAGVAVKVSQEGSSFTMKTGSKIYNCRNVLTDNNRGGAVTADTKSTVRLLGGVIEDCTSDRGGGVFIGNETTVEVGGAFTATDNTASDGSANDVYVAKTSDLVLVSPFTGAVGYVPGVDADTNVFGRVATAFSGTDAQLANSAHNFTHDLTKDVGIAVKPKTGKGEELLVWSNALDVDGNVVINGTNYVMVAGGETLTAEITSATTNLVYNGQAQLPTLDGHGYVVTCEAQTNVGDYTATLTLKDGFQWDDGTTAAKTIDWSIEKATYDMSGVTFEDATFEYDGSAKSIYVGGTLPSGVTVSYGGNGKTEVGVYTVTANFTGDSDNYNSIESLTATLTITEPSPTPGPEPTPTVVTNTPTPIAFQSITKVSEEDGTTTWRLVITNRVPWCNYRLIYTDDLAKGFVTTGAWEQAAADADPVWTTNVTTSTGAYFWKAEGKDGEVGD